MNSISFARSPLRPHFSGSTARFTALVLLACTAALPANLEPRYTALVEPLNLIEESTGIAAHDRLRGVMELTVRNRWVVTPDRPVSDDDTARTMGRNTPA